MTKAKAFIFMLVITILALSASPVCAYQEQRSFLLESQAEYEIRVVFDKDYIDSPILITTYVTKEEKPVLHSYMLHGGTRHVVESTEEFSFVFKSPPGVSKATLSFGTPEMLQIQHFDIKRVSQNVDTSVANQNRLYSGLIIDARGLGLKRGMSPRIWSESGELIYAGITTDYEYVQNFGVVSYGRELSTGLLSRLTIGSKESSYIRPLVVRGIKVVGETKTGVVISDEAAREILSAIDKYDFFSKHAVVFLLD